MHPTPHVLLVALAGALFLACGPEPAESSGTTTTTSSGGGGSSSTSGGTSTGGSTGGSGAAGTTTTTTGTSSIPEPIALGGDPEEAASSLALGPDDVYWASLVPHQNGTADFAIKKAPKQPGATSIEASVVCAYSIAVDTAVLYWADGSSIWKKPIGGGAMEVLASGQSLQQGMSIATDATRVFWPAPDDGAVRSVGKDGSSLTEIASGQDYPLRVAVDDANVYWTNNADPGAVMSAPKDGGPATVLAPGEPFPFAIAVDATHVYWSTNGDQAVKRVPKAGGPVEVVAANRFVTAIALDPQSAYWLRADLGVERAPKSGGAPVPLSTGQTGCFDIALDDSFVYWTRNAVTNGSKVLKTPK